MDTYKNTQKISTITLALILIISIVVPTVLIAEAQTATIIEYDTFTYIVVTPNPVGVSQETYVQFRIDKVSPTSTGEAGGDHFTGFTVEITTPEGNTETHGPYTTDSTSGSWMLFTPTMVGDYTLQAKFPGQWINGTSGSIFGPPGPPLDRWYKPSESAVLTLTVQEDSVAAWEDVPLPTGYWERPIYSENKGWWQISDNWLMPGYDRTSRMFHWQPAYAPYTSAPDSPHVLWTKQVREGGIVGGQFGDVSYYTGLSYEQPDRNMIILNGRLIYTLKTQASDNNGVFGPIGPFGILGTCIVDLYTGEEIMFLDGIEILFAQTLAFDTSNMHGVHTHLWESIPGGYNVYDGFTAAYMFTINNVPSGTTVFGPNGEVLIYGLSNGQLSLWNSTKAILTESAPRWGVTVQTEYYNIPIGAQVNGSLGFEWNVEVSDVGVPTSISLISVTENVIIASASDSSVYPTLVTEVAYPALLDRDSSGNYPTSINHLWVETRQDNYGDNIRRSINIDEGIYATWDEARAILTGYSATTGAKLWQTTQIPSEGLVTFSHNVVVAYNKVYISGYDGHVRAFNTNDGTLAWDYYKGSAGYETPYGTWPDYGGYTIADGKIYVSADEHSPDSTLWRGSRLWCIDAHTGEGLWEISGMLRHPLISDGILVSINSYDGKIYAIGTGKSATTVTAPDTGITLGESLVLKGTITDQSPGQEDAACVSDGSMGNWMGYLYQQKPMPSDAVGVEVTIDVLDANGNYRNIGTVTSDLSGNFGLAWTPDIEGFYTVIATFGGSNSYGSSYAMTYFNADPAQSAATPIEPEQPTAEAPLITTEVAIIAVVAVVSIIGVVAFWVLKKRK